MNRSLFCGGVMAFLVFSVLSLGAQENAAQRHQMATNHLKRVAAELPELDLSATQTRADWERQRPRLHRQLSDMLGLDPLPKRTPLRVKITGVLERPAFRIEKIVFQSSPGLYVTGNLYVPTHSSGPLPTILYLCGHAPHPLGAKVNYQDRAAWFAAHGFVCLILDTLEFGEVAGIHHGTHDLNMWHWLSLGYSPAGTEVWNAMRALDYLETRPEVDAQRIGVTGISGGGAITWYLAALDQRVQAAAPVCSTYTFGSQAADWRAAGQCDCIYFHNVYAWDFPMVAALIAPRPLLMISGRKDWDFPRAGYHEVFQQSKLVYDLYADGNSDRIREFDHDVGHTDAPEFLREARQWMRRWLQNDAAPLNLETNPPSAEAATNLACLAELPSDAINYRIHNQFTPLAILRQPRSRAAWKERRADILRNLDERTFRWFPKTNMPFATQVSRNRGGWETRYADYKEVTFQTEEGVRVRAQLLTPKQGAADRPLLIYVKRAGDSIYAMDYDELLPVLGRVTVLIVHPRFTEVTISAAEHAVLEMTASWSGRTVASMQVWDIARAVEWILVEEKLQPSSVVLYGKGSMGILALYAAVRDSRVTQVILNDPPVSHWQGPALLHTLRFTDVAEVAAALAPRRLTCLTPLPATFRVTQAIYKLEKASPALETRGSLPEALRIWKKQSGDY
jgi:cephalosporin-C deacetylase-like acetyl esterase